MLAIKYRSVTRSAKPCPSELGNYSRVTNSGAKNIAEEKIKPIAEAMVKVVFGCIGCLQLFA